MTEERTSGLMEKLNKMSDSSDDFLSYQKKHLNDTSITLSDYLNSYIASHETLSTKLIIDNSNLSKDYANQFFNGNRKHPGKYKLLAICIAMGMNVKEADRALLLAGQPKLSPKIDLDAAFIICLNHKYMKMDKVEEFLASVGISMP